MAEPRIISILRAHGDWMPAAQLIDRYCVQGASRSTAYNAMFHARNTGHVERRGKNGGYEYRLKPGAPDDITIPAPRERSVNRRDPDDGQARLAQAAAVRAGPVQSREHLSPSLGLLCGDPEVMPPEVGRIIDGLHRAFYEHFARVE